jgi:hypothetical protein
LLPDQSTTIHNNQYKKEAAMNQFIKAREKQWRISRIAQFSGAHYKNK